MRRVFYIVVAILVLAAGFAYVMFRRDLSDAFARLAGRSQTIETSFGAMEYAAAGLGQPVLSIHGGGGGFDQAIEITGPLAGRGYQLIAPSRFGYLGSVLLADLTTAMQADAYVDLLDSRGIDKAYVIGVSAGAWSAMQFVIRHPERCRALALLAPAAYTPTGRTYVSGGFVKTMLSSDFLSWAVLKLMPRDAMIRMMLGTDPALVHAAEPSEQVRVQQILTHMLPVRPRHEGMLFDMKIGAAPEPYPLETIACPVLTISAEDDLFGTNDAARYVAANLRDGRAVVYPSDGHGLVGHHGEVLGEITSFFGRY